MRFNLQALALAPVVFFILAALSHPLRAGASLNQGAGIERRHLLPPHDLIPRSLGDYLQVEARVNGGPPAKPYRPQKPKQKLSPQDQRNRKAAATQAMKKATAKNQGEYERWQALGQKARRKAGFDKPHHPKPPMQKGAQRSEKAIRTQKEALQKKNDNLRKKDPGFAQVRASYGQMTNLPSRHTVFATKHGENVKGRQVRTAIFNSHYFAPNAPHMNPRLPGSVVAPKPFQNRPQGPKGAQKVPIRTMQGPGTEFPITKVKGGYQAPGDSKGPMRVVTQGNVFKGVISHDPSRDINHPGHRDHFQVRPMPAQRPVRGVARLPTLATIRE